MAEAKYSIGIDEAGRGPLAGPVYVGIVLAPVDFDFGIFPYLDDSKRMTEKRREAVFRQLRNVSDHIQTLALRGTAENIDRQGINPTIQQAIDRGLEQISVPRDEVKVWLDGGLQADDSFAQEAVVGGDGTVPIISLASVVAKVTRDQYMKKQSEMYPVYGLAQHKGYGTAQHREMIKKHGLSPIHRRSYTTKIIADKNTK